MDGCRLLEGLGCRALDEGWRRNGTVTCLMPQAKIEAPTPLRSMRWIEKELAGIVEDIQCEACKLPMQDRTIRALTRDVSTHGTAELECRAALPQLYPKPHHLVIFSPLRQRIDRPG